MQVYFNGVTIYSQLSIAKKTVKMAIYSQLSLAKNVKLTIYSQLSLAKNRLNGYLQSKLYIIHYSNCILRNVFFYLVLG